MSGFAKEHLLLGPHPRADDDMALLSAMVAHGGRSTRHDPRGQAVMAARPVHNDLRDPIRGGVVR